MAFPDYDGLAYWRQQPDPGFPAAVSEGGSVSFLSGTFQCTDEFADTYTLSLAVELSSLTADVESAHATGYLDADWLPVPEQEWVSPPLGTPGMVEVAIGDLNPQPDYYTLMIQAAKVETVQLWVGTRYYPPTKWSVPSGSCPPAGVTVVHDVDLAISGGSIDTSSAPGGTTHTATEDSLFGLVIPDSQDLDPSITPEVGDLGTRLLWRWGTFPTIEASFPGEYVSGYKHLSWAVTPFWLTSRAAGIETGAFGRGVRAVGGTLRAGSTPLS